MEEFNSEQNQNKSDESKELKSIAESYSPYPLISPVAAAFLGLIGGFILYQGLGSILTVLMFGADLEAMPVDGLRLTMIISQILFLFLPALFLSQWIYGDITKIISIKLPHLKELLLFVLGIIILIPFLQSYLYIQNYFIEQWAESSQLINSIKYVFDTITELNEKTLGNLIHASNFGEMLLVIITISIIPAICEEVIFRGYIQRSFEFKFKSVIAALFTALFFGAFHANPYSFIPLSIIGFYLGYAAYASQSLLIPIVLHFLNNFISIMLYFIIGDDELINSNVTDTESFNENVIYFFILLILFIALIFLIKNYYKKNKNLVED